MPVLNCLVVDDSAVVRTQLRMGIEEIIPDCHVFESESALDAARFLSRFIPEVVFLDLNMPGVSGLDFLDRLDKICGVRKPPIIVSITSEVTPKVMAAFKDRGAYDLLPKPFNKVELAATLLRLIQMSRSRRVLVLDDSATVRSVVRRVILKSRFNLEVDEAANAQEALKILAGQTYDLAFIDMHMPGIDGLEVAGEILYTRQGVHIVMMSGDKNEDIQRAAAHIGVQHFLTKPFFAADIDAVLHTIYGLSDAQFLAAAAKLNFSAPDEQDDSLDWKLRSEAG